jgi:hypothetical protein
MRALRNHLIRLESFGKLEVLLVLAFAALLFQVFPSLWFGILRALHVQNWGRVSWLLLNLAALFLLFAIRFWPDIVGNRRQRSVKRRVTAPRVNREQTHDWKEMDANEQKELFRRMQEARKNQVL